MNIDEMPASREMDKLIAEHIFQEEVIGMQIPDGIGTAKRFSWTPIPHYSTDIAAAWKVVEAMLAKGFYPVIQAHAFYNPPRWIAHMGLSQAMAPTPALAICRAALRATDSK